MDDPPTLQDRLRGALTQIALFLRFYARLPAPALPWESDTHGLPDFARSAWLLPVAGAIIGCVAALVFFAAHLIRLGPTIAAILAVAALVIVTGAFHEDGLADTADGFWGGATAERRLEIMKDSRIGSYGAAALALSLMLRVAALAAFSALAGVAPACAALILVCAFSRVCGLLPLALLPPARPDGAGAAAGRPGPASLALAVAVAAAMVLLVGAATNLPQAGLPAMAVALGAAAAVTHISRRKIGGQTGDVAGAAQQLAEVAFLLALVAGA